MAENFFAQFLYEKEPPKFTNFFAQFDEEQSCVHLDLKKAKACLKSLAKALSLA